MTTQHRAHKWISRAGLGLVLACSISFGALPLYRDSLPNGMVILTFEQTRLPVVDIEFVCRSGANYDPPGKAGVANLVGDMLTRGTKSLSADSFSSIIEFLGAQFDGGAGRDNLTITAKALSKDLNTILDLIADAVRNPAFDTVEFKQAREQHLAGARRMLDYPNAVVRQEMDRLLFAGGPLASQASGDTGSLPKIVRQDLVDFVRDWVVPNNCYIVVVGDVDRSDIKAAIEKRFGAWAGRDLPGRTFPAPAFPDRLKVKLIARPDMNQTYVTFGHPGISISDPDRLAVALMSYILGGSALSSRLGLAVREKEGLAYDVRSTFDQNTLPGAFRASVQTAKPKEAVRLMLDNIRLMHDSGVTAAELDKAHKYFTGSFPLTYSSNEGKLSRVANIELYHLGMDWLEKYPGKIDAITLDQVNQAARDRLQPGKYVMVVMGNVAKEDLGLNGVEWIE